MSVETTGVALVATILAHMARGEPATAADLARDLGTARSTTFAVICQLEAANLVERDAKGMVRTGQAAAALGYALSGLGRLTGAAEALLPALRDDTDARVELVVRHGPQEAVLVARMATVVTGAHTDLTADFLCLERVVTGGSAAALLRLYLRPQSPDPEREAARLCLHAVADSLSALGADHFA